MQHTHKPSPERAIYIKLIKPAITAIWWTSAVFLIFALDAFQYYETIFLKNRLEIDLVKTETVGDLFISEFLISNPGDPISLDDQIVPITVTLNGNDIVTACEIISTRSPKTFTTQISKDQIRVKFDLLQFDECIRLLVYTRKPIHSFEISQRIRGIKIMDRFFHSSAKKERLKIIAIIASIIVCILIIFDWLAFLLKDRLLQQIYGHIKTLTLKSDKEEFINTYGKLYSQYNVRVKFPKRLVLGYVSDTLDQLNDQNVEVVTNNIIKITSACTFYSVKSFWPITLPVLFGALSFAIYITYLIVRAILSIAGLMVS